MRIMFTMLAVAVLAGVPLAAQAQASRAVSRWSLELSGDGSFPSGKLGTAELDAGIGFGANIRARLQPHLQVYAGWEWHRFSSGELVSAQDVDVEETGYTLGLRFDHGFRSEEVATATRAFVPGYWLRAGALYNHLEVENQDGDIIEDSGHGLGWEAGAGITIPIGARLGLTPGVRYRALSRELTLGTTTRDVTLKYVSAMLGLTIQF